MGQILTFLGKGGTGRSTVAIAFARAAVKKGRRVLLVEGSGEPALELLLGGISLSLSPTPVAPNLYGVRLKSTSLLEQSWTQARQVESEYIKTPFFKDIYSQELPILPGMDQVLTLDALRRYEASGEYDCIIYDGAGDLSVLRMLGVPEVASWYWRRASKAFLDSDLAKTLRPFAEPLIRSVSTVDFNSLEDISKQVGGQSNWLEDGRKALSNPDRVLAHLVTSADPIAIQSARFLWGSAQMIGITVGSVLVSPLGNGSAPTSDFSPLPLYSLPRQQGSEWSELEAAISPALEKPNVPPPVAIDESSGIVKLFIPGFSKSQIELSQSGPELTITAGDQRRNVSLPLSLAGRQVKGAKFQEQYLIISFG